MIFNSNNEINRIRKEINRLLNKGMFLIQLKKKIGKEKRWISYKRKSNICLNVTVEKNWRSQNFDFLSSKNL